MEVTVDRIIGTAVYSIEKGIRLGQVRRFLLDPIKKELIALLITDKKWFKDEMVLNLTDVTGLSIGAITVDSPEVLRKKTDCPHLKDLLKSPPDIFGLSVIKKNGSYLGKAESYYIETETGAITKIELTPEKQKGFFRGSCPTLGIEDIEIIGTDMILARDSAVIQCAPAEKSSAKSVCKEKLPEFSKGCGEKITALSDKMWHRRDAVIFPEITVKPDSNTPGESSPEN